MAIKIYKNSFSGKLLGYLLTAGEILTTVARHPSRWDPYHTAKDQEDYRRTIYRLLKSGLIEIAEESGKKIYKLTKEGEVSALVYKTRLPVQGKWDGKWRMVVFDIPEDNKNERNQLRRLLLDNNFLKLQASVYISPFAINREAIAYLKETGLIKYIRFARIDELDEDKDLKRRFNL